VIVLGAQSNSERQAELIAQATKYIYDEIYILAVPLLEEAAGYNAAHTLEAEALLKRVYLQLLDQRGVRRKYLDLLDKQMSRRDVSPDVFYEAASFQLENSKFIEALEILKDGIERTESNDLIMLYENNRYVYRLGFNFFEDVTAFHGTTIGVSRDGLWGIANSEGALLIPFEYEKISTFSADRAIVQRDGVIFAVDRNNNRLALLKENVSDFGNYADSRVALLMADGWRRASGDFEMGSAAFEQIGTYSGGYAAAMQNGKWGVIDRATTWLIPAEYDEILMDELGRSYGQGAVFARKGSSVYLIVDGVQTGDTFEDARPFGNEGYAAVKNNGQWGFINTAGDVVIRHQFEDALSFGQHLAAVKQGEYWGYVNLFGDIVIETIFLQAKSFANGNAPVLTERGWQFLSLLEYRKGASL
jgi:hypothetical protein